MNAQRLSPRLNQVADYVIHYNPQNIRLADIGSDHAYLPCFLALNHPIEIAIAGEVAKGPFESAKKEVAIHHLQETVAVRLGDGLDVIHPEDRINTITICGMGGVLIRDILQKNLDLLDHTLLVLQPNVASESLRTWLAQNSFEMIDECVIEDNLRYYDIIVARKTSLRVALTAKELLLGPINIRRPSQAFKNKWLHELQQYHLLLDKLLKNLDKNHPKVIEIRGRIQAIEEEII